MCDVKKIQHLMISFMLDAAFFITSTFLFHPHTATPASLQIFRLLVVVFFHVIANLVGQYCTPRLNAGKVLLHIMDSYVPLSPLITELSICPASLPLPAHCVDAPGLK